MDYNATTPCTAGVVEAMSPYFTSHFGNAASKSHPYGWLTEDAVELARENVANLIGAKTKEVIFTSGATEAINLAILGISEYYRQEQQHYITCKTEHKAVLDCYKKLENNGNEVTYLPVNEDGIISLIELENAIRPQTKMIALMWANNETGVIHPIEEMAAIAEKHGIIFFTDAVQAAGKIPINTNGIHLMALSAHKLYGPKGVGALYIRHNHSLPKPIPMQVGGGHEKGFRSGTLNVPGIVGFGKAAEEMQGKMASESVRLQKLRNLLENSLLELPGTRRNGSDNERLPHVTNIGFEDLEGEEFLRIVCQKVAVSSGSACTSISPKPSHVLKAMGIASEVGKASIRFSLGLHNTEDEVYQAIMHVKNIVTNLRKPINRH